VEEETESLRKQLLEAHEAEMDSLKLKLEEEANEKQEEQRKSHEQGNCSNPMSRRALFSNSINNLSCMR